MAFESEQPAAAGSDPASAIPALVAAELPNWRAVPDFAPHLCRQVGNGWVVGGIAPNGNAHMKITNRAPDGPDTPDDPVEAARWLQRHFGGGVVADDGVVSFHVESAPLEAPETDELWAPDFGAEMFDAEGDAEQIPGDENWQSPQETERLANAGSDLGAGDVSPDSDAAESLLDLGSESAGGGGSGGAGEGTVSPSYPGVAILNDDISIALAQVIEAVAAEEEARVIAVEALQSDDLQNFRDYSNWPQGVEMPAHV